MPTALPGLELGDKGKWMRRPRTNDASGGNVSQGCLKQKLYKQVKENTERIPPQEVVSPRISRVGNELLTVERKIPTIDMI
jgi:hypothetical protein